MLRAWGRRGVDVSGSREARCRRRDVEVWRCRGMKLYCIVGISRFRFLRGCLVKTREGASRLDMWLGR